MKKLIIFLCFTIALFVSGCEVVCEEPYIYHDVGCCLDTDGNGICDTDEGLVTDSDSYDDYDYDESDYEDTSSDTTETAVAVSTSGECEDYYGSVAASYELYTTCVDNELTRAMLSGDPYYCSVAMNSDFIDSNYKFWVLDHHMKYSLTLKYDDGEVQQGTYILKRDGTYQDTTNTLYGDIYYGDYDWLYISSSDLTPAYNVAGNLEAPVTVDCNLMDFGNEMFEMSNIGDADLY